MRKKKKNEIRESNKSGESKKKYNLLTVSVIVSKS